MSLIEKAVERLDGMQLKPPGVGDSSPKQDAVQVPAPAARGGNPDARHEAGAVSPDSGVRSRSVQIDLDMLSRSGFVKPDEPKSLTAEEFRVLKRPLLTNVVSPAAPIRNSNLIMVTSSLPGEGKTFTAVNLAISIAMEVDRTVLLVDADVARPSVPRVLGIPEQKGLMDVLQDKSLDLSDVLLKTNIDKLTLLTAGSQDSRSTELLASKGMARLLDELARRYSDRIIIFDSPPLLVTTEARVLGSLMGQLVFVVRAEATPKSAVKDALAAIETCPVKLMVLNQARNVEHMAYGYEYGYGY